MPARLPTARGHRSPVDFPNAYGRLYPMGAIKQPKAPSRVLLVSSIGAGLGLAIGGGAALDHLTIAAIEPSSPIVRALPAMHTPVEVLIRNRHPWKSLRVESATARCGCLEVVSVPDGVPPRSTGVLRFSAWVDPYAPTTRCLPEVPSTPATAVPSLVSTTGSAATMCPATSAS